MEARNVASAATFYRLPPDKEKTVILQGRGGPPEVASQKVCCFFMYNFTQSARK